MTARELLALLETFPGDTPVVVRDHEYGYTDLTAHHVTLIELDRNAFPGWGVSGGPHEEDPVGETVLLLDR